MSIEVYAPRRGEFDRREAYIDTYVVGLDTEFAGDVYSEDGRLRLVQFATDKRAFVFDMEDPEQKAFATEILSNEKHVFVAHAALIAEYPVIRRHLGVDLSGRLIDTYTLACLAWPGDTRDKGLKDLAPEVSSVGKELVALSLELHERFVKLGNDAGLKLKAEVEDFGWRHVPSWDDIYVRYAGLDAFVVRELYFALLDHLREIGVPDATVDFELRVNSLASRMSYRGWRVDRGRMVSLSDTVGVANAEASDQFFAKTGVKARSPKRAEVLANLGVVFDQFTDKGSPKLGKENIRELAGRYPDVEELQILLRISETSNVVLFLKSLEGQLGFDGRAHAAVRTLGAVSGRWTVTHPALQTVSSKSGTREIFVPDSDDHVLLSADLGQIEPRIAFALAGAESMIQYMNGGVDAYSAAASLVFGADYSPFQRKLTKRIILGSLYAAGVATLTKQAKYLDGWQDASEEGISAARDQFNSSVPEVRKMGWWLQRQPDVRLPSGRWAPQDQDRLYRATNSLVQGAARDALMTRLLALDELGLGEFIVATLHDEILFSIPAARLRDYSAQIRSVMEVGFHGCPTPSDIEIYINNWGEPPLTVDEACTRLGL